MISKKQLNVGDKLIAISPCTMNDTTIDALTVGKEYEIKSFELNEDENYDLIPDDEFEDYDFLNCILIIDDQDNEHLYPINELEKWFKLKDTSSSMSQNLFRIFKY